MITRELPPESVMLEAFFGRDATFDRVFVTGVHTTGVFCRPTCPAKKPSPQTSPFSARRMRRYSGGYRPCRRCRPLEPSGSPPEWLQSLLEAVEADPVRRWTDRDVRSRGLSPERVRRWFKQKHGMTFQAYNRAGRLGAALGRVQVGSRVSRAAFDVGYDSLSGFQEAFRQYFGQSPKKLDDATVVRVTRITTPLGPILVGATEDALCLLEFGDRRMLPGQIQRIRHRLGAVFVPDRNDLIDRVERDVVAYFAGELRDFDAPLKLCGTDFQKEVWESLREIPYGETRSYATLARTVGATHCGASRRSRERNERAGDHRPVPPHRRGGRQAGRLRRRPLAKTQAARSGA